MANDNKNEARGLYRYFDSPVKGVLDILLVMVIITLAVVFLGPIIIEPLAQSIEQEPSVIERPIEDYLVDEDGNVYGRIEIEYHDNGAFKKITERNERDNRVVKAFYSEDNKFLYWVEIELDEHGEVVSERRFSPDGQPIGG